MKQHPVGAIWECRDGKGRVGKIWLKSRDRDFEIWMYAALWNDGSGDIPDWAPSYATARRLLLVDGRMKRVI